MVLKHLSKGDRRRTPPLEHEAHESKVSGKPREWGGGVRLPASKKQLAAKLDERQPDRQKIKDKEANR